MPKIIVTSFLIPSSVSFTNSFLFLYFLYSVIVGSIMKSKSWHIDMCWVWISAKYQQQTSMKVGGEEKMRQPIIIIGSISSISIQLSSAHCYFSPLIDRFCFSNSAFVPVSSSTIACSVLLRERRFDFLNAYRRASYWIDLQPIWKQWTHKCQLRFSNASWWVKNILMEGV